MEVPRNIEEAIAITSEEVVMRGMVELREVFMDPEFTDEQLKNALQACDLNVANAVDYLTNLKQQVEISEPIVIETGPKQLYFWTYPQKCKIILELPFGLEFSMSQSDDSTKIPLMFISDDIVYSIFCFLNPWELGHCAQVCRTWWYIERKKSGKIYKDFSSTLNLDKFKVDHFAKFPFPYNSADALWGEGYPDMYNLDPSYVDSFGSWRNMWLNFPRIKLHGTYRAKTKYIRVGDTFGVYHQPVHLIKFYRYFRFFQDGMLYCYTTNNKLRNPYLDIDQAVEEEHENMKVGEWIILQNRVIIQVAAKETIFKYELEIRSDPKYSHNILKLKGIWYRTVQNPSLARMDRKAKSCPKLFRFVPFK